LIAIYKDGGEYATVIGGVAQRLAVEGAVQGERFDNRLTAAKDETERRACSYVVRAEIESTNASPHAWLGDEGMAGIELAKASKLLWTAAFLLERL
jgi:hypothetical protein